MIYRIRETLALVCLATAVAVLDAVPAMAQIVESDVDAQPGTTKTTQLVTSSTEVRRAVIGLLCIAAAAGLVFVFYWYKSGQQARQRFARQFVGRHVDDPQPPRRRRRRA